MITIQRSLLHTAPLGWIHARGKADDTVDLYYRGDVIPPLPAETLAQAKARRINSINAEARERIAQRYPIEEQIAATAMLYSEPDCTAIRAWQSANYAAAATAETAITAATTILQVEGVTVTWPV